MGKASRKPNFLSNLNAMTNHVITKHVSQEIVCLFIDVLLAALSDTLNENPDVMEKARHALNAK